MKYFAIIDCGTTNSRVYILNQNHEIINKGSRKVGVRDTALYGTRNVLRLGLKKLIEETISSVDLSIQDISFAITSGMITSEIGLLEIPHLWAPVGINDLASNIKIVKDFEILPLDIPLYFIRGVKNFFPENTTYKDIRRIDFMRGEETQAAGLISSYANLDFPINIIVLSSHTKYIHINKERKIRGSLTTLSGQIYEAIKKETSISKSITNDLNEENKDYYDENIIVSAYDAVINAGFLRALMMPRFMEVLLTTSWYERELFLNAAIVADDLIVLSEFKSIEFPWNCDFVIIGQKIRCKIFSYLLNKYYIKDKNIHCIYNEENIDNLSIEGSIAIAQKAGCLNQ